MSASTLPAPPPSLSDAAIRTSPATMPALLPISDAARYLGITTRGLYDLRYKGQGPRWTKIGGAPRYSIAMLDEYIAANTVIPEASGRDA